MNPSPATQSRVLDRDDSLLSEIDSGLLSKKGRIALQ
jgi:hypothetical protein